MTREGLRSQTNQGKEDEFPSAQLSPIPSDSEAEEQPNLKQIMKLMAQTQSQMQMLQTEVANIKAAIMSIPSVRDALGGEEKNSHADTNLVSSFVEEHIPSERTTQADSNTEPAISLADPNREPAISAPISASCMEPESSSLTMEEKFRKWINRISFLSYGDVKSKSAAGLYRKLRRLRNEFVSHTGKLVTKIWQIF